MSRCTMPSRCAAWSAAAASSTMRRASSTGRWRSRSRRARSDSPGTYAMAYQGTGSPSRPRKHAGVEHGNDVGMLEPGGEPDLANESVHADRARQLGMQHLDGHRPVVTPVARQPHRGHAAPAQLALHRVPVGQRRVQVVEHAGSRCGIDHAGRILALGAGRQPRPHSVRWPPEMGCSRVPGSRRRASEGSPDALELCLIAGCY